MGEAERAPGSTVRLRPATVLMATLLGAVSGLAAALVRLGFRGLEWVFTGSAGLLPQVAHGLGPWRRVLTPILGAACATALLALRSWRDRRRGRKPAKSVEYVEAVRHGHGRIPLVPNLWRTGASAFSVATGAPIGREGSMIQFAAAITSWLHRVEGRRAKRRLLPGKHRLLLAKHHLPLAKHRLPPAKHRLPPALAVACGVAAGVTVAYHAPLAGVLFAAEIVLGEFDPRAMVLLACAAAAGFAASWKLTGVETLYRVGTPLAVQGRDWIVLPLLGVLYGVMGPVYQRWLHLWTAARKLPFALVLGSLVAAFAALRDPRVWGNGDVGLANALGLHWTHGLWSVSAGALAALLGWRMLGTAAATGAGTVGGVFTPTLLAGGLSAALLAHVLGVGDPVLFAVVGMAALIAAATHAPLMAAVMVVELTGEWRLLPVLLVASVLAWLVARQISSDALYGIASGEPVHRGLQAPHARLFREPGRG